jgi:competence protein ComEC
MVLAGFDTEHLRTLSVDAPVLRAPRSTMSRHHPRRRGAQCRQRLLLDDLVIERIAPSDAARVRSLQPRRAAIICRASGRLRAQLSRRAGRPCRCLDFAQHAFFLQIGGVGFALGAPERVTEAESRARPISALRFAIADRIERVLPGVSGAITAALFTGLRASIPEEVWRDMQISGLVHILSISGMHMTLVAGTVFLASRFLFSLWPALALRVAPKKPAAIVGIIAAAGYLMLGGTNAPTQRSFITATVVFIAILLDRTRSRCGSWPMPPSSWLVLAPENLLGPSFQMSFAATIVLIAYYERHLKNTGLGARRARRSPIAACRARSWSISSASP